MKISKTRLKEIIKEELSSVLNENPSPPLSKDEWLKILNFLESQQRLEPDTPIEKYADELVDNEVAISDFNPEVTNPAVTWKDLVAELGITITNAKSIALHIQNLAKGAR